MTSLEESCLLRIVDAALNTKDNYVIKVELPVLSQDERNDVSYSLAGHGYISQLNLMGQKYIGCQVEEKALIFALKYYEKR